MRVACAAADRVSLSVAATAAGGSSGGGGGGGGSTAAEAAEATAATAAALAFLAAGLVALALSICCPELPHPLGGPEVT